DENPARTYVMLINDDGEVTADEPFGTFYYPSATRREDAVEISVGPGEHKVNFIIKAPRTADVITVDGLLLFEDGKPAAGKDIEFYKSNRRPKPGSDYVSPDSGTTADSSGRFSLRVLKGQSGDIIGSMTTYKGENRNCPKLDKLIMVSRQSIPDIKTNTVKFEAMQNLS